MNRQQTFDTVVAHLRKQGKQATIDGHGCAYRGDNGTKCAVGCLIPDSEYREEFEGWPVGGVMGQCMALQDHDVDLLASLQRVHDANLPYDWEKRFQTVAKMYGLTYESPANV